MREIAALAALGFGLPASGYDFIESYDPANPNTRLAQMPHFTPERPLTKRQRRRLRGKAVA